MKNFFKKTSTPRSDLKSPKRSDIGVLKKTILIFTLAGVIFLGGGVGVVRADNHIPNQPTTPATTKVAPVADARSSPPVENKDLNMVEGGAGQNTLELINCGGFWDKLSLGCIMPVLTYSLYVVIAGVLTLSSYIFDSILELSINRDFIAQGFVDTLWKVMRDFSNMVFIFALLYAGIRTMIFGDSWHKPVMMVVVIALLINFSLFFTKIIIDAGNVLAVGVYSGLGVTAETPVSATMVNRFAPQQFFKLSAEKKDLAPTIFIIAGIASGFLAYILFKVSLLFIGRILAFWALMILSPFAFITLAFPMLGAKAKFSFGAWIDMLINQAFVAPVFLFFLYIIMTVVQSGLLDGFGAPSGAGMLMDLLFKPALFAVIIVFALKQALKVADSMSGEFGKIGANIGNKALGLGLGLASGGASLVGREVIGSRAAKVLGSGYFGNMAEKGGIVGRFIGRQGEGLATQLSKSSFDARGVGFVSKALKSEGIDAGKAQKSGYMADRKAQEKADAERAKRMEMTDAEKEKIPGYKEAKEAGGRKKEIKVMEESSKKAEKEATESASGRRVAETGKRETAAVSMAGDASIKKLEAEKRKNAALNGVQKAKAIEELEEARVVEQKALEELRDARKEAEKAKEIHSSSTEVRALENAKKNLDELKEVIEQEKDFIKKTEQEIVDRNTNRREISGKASTFSRFYLTKNDQREAIKKIRKGPSDKEKEEESAVKTLKKLLDKQKEGEEKPAEEKKEEKPAEIK